MGCCFFQGKTIPNNDTFKAVTTLEVKQFSVFTFCLHLPLLPTITSAGSLTDLVILPYDLSNTFK